jgi:proteic killer suppression protein
MVLTRFDVLSSQVFHLWQVLSMPCLCNILGNAVAQHTTLVTVKTVRHKGLRKFYFKGTLAGIQARHSKTLRFQLAALDSAQLMDDFDLPGYRVHPLKGRRERSWSITVSAN